jgi:hypothetical protein
MDVRLVDAHRVLGLIAVPDGVALVVAGVADEPLEDARAVGWVGDPTVGRRPIPRRDVVAAD